jgi:hypothetical protein
MKTVCFISEVKHFTSHLKFKYYLREKKYLQQE